jgi:hypothetical protein
MTNPVVYIPILEDGTILHTLSQTARPIHSSSQYWRAEWAHYDLWPYNPSKKMVLTKCLILFEDHTSKVMTFGSPVVIEKNNSLFSENSS